VAQRTCSDDGCDRVAKVRGFCEKHYQQRKRAGEFPQPAFVRGDHIGNFWRKVDRRGPDECWPWTGGVSAEGYGRFTCGRRVFFAHRFAYEDHREKIPDGYFIDHLCHTNDPTCRGGPTCPHRRCCNPAHHEVVTPSESSKRTGSRLIACRRGHPYVAGSYRIEPSTGRRSCIVCGQINWQRWYHKPGNAEHANDNRRARNAKKPKQPNYWASKTHCKRGHEFTPENTRWSGRRRHCRACGRMHSAASRARKAA
jgi:hypothetical protein